MSHSFLHYFLFMDTTDLTSFIFAYRIQLILSIIALLINLIICLYSFYIFDCYNPHTTMWKTQLIIDIFISIENTLFPQQQQQLINYNISSSSSSLINLLNNNTVNDCNSKKPHLFILLICRQWTAILVFIMGLERLLLLCYPLWFRSFRISKGPVNTFTLFFALFSSGICYINASINCPFELTHFTCEVTWAFGIDYGYIFNYLIILLQLFGLIFFIIAYIFINKENWLLRRFGGNRNKVASEKRKIRKIKWLIFSCLLFNALPQLLLFILYFINSNRFYFIKLIISWIFILKMFSNIYIYYLATRYGKGIICLIKEKWENRRKININPSDSIATIAASQFINRQINLNQMG